MSKSTLPINSIDWWVSEALSQVTQARNHNTNLLFYFEHVTLFFLALCLKLPKVGKVFHFIYFRSIFTQSFWTIIAMWTLLVEVHSWSNSFICLLLHTTQMTPHIDTIHPQVNAMKWICHHEATNTTGETKGRGCRQIFDPSGVITGVRVIPLWPLKNPCSSLHTISQIKVVGE